MPLRVAICGDSAMWGQGLLREHTYAHLASAEIARLLGETLEVVPGRSEFEPLRGEARSGAKIRAKQDKDALAFINDFPLLVRLRGEELELTHARDESPGARLFGENPATFPTVSDAVRHLGQRDGADVGLVLIDGGINDIDFQEVLDPEGPGLGKIARALKEIFFDSLELLVRETRQAFPRAVIVVVGYFSALSDRSDRGELERLFIHLADKPDWQVALNDFVQGVPLLREFTNSAGITKDVDGLIKTAINRSVAAAAQAHFWTRRTINGLPGSVVGPGILYAHPSWRPQHALFAGNSLLYEGYRLPGEGRRAVADEMLSVRTATNPVPDLGLYIPRLPLLEDYRRIRGEARALLNPMSGGATFVSDLDRLVRSLKLMLSEEDLPKPLRAAAREIVGSKDIHKLLELNRALSREIGRLEIATISSFIHPNVAGARRISDRIVAAYRDHQRFSIRSAVGSMKIKGERGVQLGTVTKRHGLDSSKGIRRLANIARIESVALQFEGLKSGVHPITLSLGGSQVQCIVNQQGSNRQFFAFDVALRLGELREVTLIPRLQPVSGPGGASGVGGLPKFDKVNLFLNAHDWMVLRSDQGRIVGDKLVLWAV